MSRVCNYGIVSAIDTLLSIVSSQSSSLTLAHTRIIRIRYLMGTTTRILKKTISAQSMSAGHVVFSRYIATTAVAAMGPYHTHERDW